MPHGARRIVKKDLSKQTPFGEVDLALLPSQGYSNRNYTFTHQNRRYLLREFLLDDRDRTAEFRIQQAAYEAGIAAKPCHLEEGYMICEFIEGDHKQHLEKEDITAVAETLKRLHALSISDIPHIHLHTLIKSRDADIVEAFETIENHPQEIVLCHNDLNPRNMLFTDNGVKLIDWEFAAYNDACFDLAAVCVEYALTPKEERFLMQQYSGSTICFGEKLDAFKVLYTKLCEEWFADHP